jgi:hypothetical protein
MMGGALGLAVLASLAASRTEGLAASGAGQPAALLGGYHVAFLVGALFAALAALIGGAVLRVSVPSVGHAMGAPVADAHGMAAEK